MKTKKYQLVVTLLIASLLGLTVLAGMKTRPHDFTAADCPATPRQGSAFAPPEPFRKFAPQGLFWHGTADLWTALPASGAWEMLPRWENGYGNKLAFWSVHFDAASEPMPDLRISARRVDMPQITTQTDHLATNAFTPEDNWFMITGVELPTAGCWEITGTYRDASVSYVVWVVP